MEIGGFTKQSLIDWEGKIAAVIFTSGCNFRCGYCHNPSLVLPSLIKKSAKIPEESVLEYLHSRKGWLEGVVITGGEPTIHTDLEDFIIKIRNFGYKIKLDTNGTNPDILEKLIKNNLVDFVAMDIKTVLESEKYGEITGLKNFSFTDNIRNSLHILRNSGIDFQLRTTIFPTHHTKTIISEIENLFINENHIFQEFRDGNNLKSFI